MSTPPTATPPATLAAPLAALLAASVIFWIKGNARLVWGCEWGPIKWWLIVGWITNTLTLFAWWRLAAAWGVWRAGVVWSAVGLAVDIALNAYFFDWNPRAALSLALIAIAAAL